MGKSTCLWGTLWKVAPALQNGYSPHFGFSSTERAILHKVYYKKAGWISTTKSRNCTCNWGNSPHLRNCTLSQGLASTSDFFYTIARTRLTSTAGASSGLLTRSPLSPVSKRGRTAVVGEGELRSFPASAAPLGRPTTAVRLRDLTDFRFAPRASKNRLTLALF